MSLADHITEIRTLASQGKSEVEIAAAVGLEIGDVATVLTLPSMAAAELPPSGASGGIPVGAVSIFPFTNAAAANDALGSDGDLCVLLDTGTIIQKAGGTWAT